MEGDDRASARPRAAGVLRALGRGRPAAEHRHQGVHRRVAVGDPSATAHAATLAPDAPPVLTPSGGT